MGQSNINLYNYVYNSPLTGTDPLGEWGFAGAVWGGVSGAVSGYISSGGKLEGALAGAAVGAAVGFVNPAAASTAGGAAGGFVGNIAGQTIDDLRRNNGNFDCVNINVGEAIGAGIGGGAGVGLGRLGTKAARPVFQSVRGTGRAARGSRQTARSDVYRADGRPIRTTTKDGFGPRTNLDRAADKFTNSILDGTAGGLGTFAGQPFGDSGPGSTNCGECN